MTFIALDANDHRFETATRTGIPAWPERRIERYAMTTDFDARNLHVGLPSGRTNTTRPQECRRRDLNAIAKRA
jgi:hypothetical protein